MKMIKPKLWILIKLIKSRQVQKQMNHSSFASSLDSKDINYSRKENNKANFLSKILCYSSSLK